ncbi:molecular chaperone Hsp90 [Streptomyces sp. UNOB3_S3]|uniref:molecular chaperone Hsp90 n=1 Tax=Streptomyces sp. UNOB3_S3 TaxID=2871682 RepID=UPI001E45EE7C|nr:molecular chaperone Hsp90 [Streptomyces sp. UNOB3_S3]
MGTLRDHPDHRDRGAHHRAGPSEGGLARGRPAPRQGLRPAGQGRRLDRRQAVHPADTVAAGRFRLPVGRGVRVSLRFRFRPRVRLSVRAGYGLPLGFGLGVGLGVGAGPVLDPVPLVHPIGHGHRRSQPVVRRWSYALQAALAPGAFTDFLTDRAAETYTALLRDWHPVGTGTLDLVPAPLAQGALDAELRRRVLAGLPDVPFLPSAAAAPADEPAPAPGTGIEGIPWTESPDASTQRPGPAAPEPPAREADTWDDDPFAQGGPGGGPQALRPRDAELVEGAGTATVAVLGELFPNLLPAGLERRPELRALGVPRVPLGEIVDRLAGAERPADWWWRLYDSLAGVDPDRLTGLPVPLADGRTAIGPRQVLLPLPPADATGPEAEAPNSERLARLGLKVAHPDAAHPLLEKLGATPSSPRAILTTPQVRAAVAASLDAGEVWDDEETLDSEALAEIVLALVRDADLAPGDEPWLAALALPDEDGELAPAGELVLPGSPFEQVIRPGELAACDAELAGRWGEQPLTAVGVLADFALVRAADVVLDPDELEPRDGDFAEPDDAGLLDAVDVWCEDVLDRLPDTPVPPVATEIVAVRDLDLVDDDAWPQALALLGRPPLRDALTNPVRILLPDGTTESVRPYTAWWLRGHPVLDGRRPAGLRVAGGDPLLEGLYEAADAGGLADEQVLRALGVRTSAAALLDEPGGAAELLSRLADPARPVRPAQLHTLYGLLADLDPDDVTLPDELRAVLDGEVRVVDAADAVVADAPDLLPLAEGVALLPVAPERAAALAELLQVRRLSEVVPAVVGTADGELRDVPEEIRVLLPGAPATYVEHEELVIDGVELDWRLGPDGVLHAATLEGVAAGLAWASGAWARRFEAAALLEDPSRTEELARARWFD